MGARMSKWKMSPRLSCSRQMIELFTSGAFWFGLILLLASQASKFFELNSSHRIFSSKLALPAKLQANDFAGPWAFRGMLILFLVSSVALYIFLCSIAPALISGWLKIVGSNAPVEHDSIIYPLYISGALVGLTQPIPGIVRITNLQKDFFHHFIGVPGNVVNVSTHFVVNIFTRCKNSTDLNNQLKTLLGDQWLSDLGKFADTLYYKQYVEHIELKTETEIKEVLAGSDREKKLVIDGLVLSACVATTRKIGGKGLSRLSTLLGISLPTPSPGLRVYASPFLLYLVSLIALLFIIPLAQGFIVKILGHETEFWPTSLKYSAQFVSTQALPLFFSAIIGIIWTQGLTNRSQSVENFNFREMIYLNAGLLLFIFGVVMIYDYCQAIFDTGLLKDDYDGEIIDFIFDRAPFFLLHSLVSIFAVLIIVSYIEKKASSPNNTNFGNWILITIGVAFSISLFYSVARLELHYRQIDGFIKFDGADFVILIVSINIISAVLAFVGANFLADRRIALSN